MSPEGGERPGPADHRLSSEAWSAGIDFVDLSRRQEQEQEQELEQE